LPANNKVFGVSKDEIHIHKKTNCSLMNQFSQNFAIFMPIELLTNPLNYEKLSTLILIGAGLIFSDGSAERTNDPLCRPGFWFIPG
jgi:hypothetical protein